jgi:hypothetical protein
MAAEVSASPRSRRLLSICFFSSCCLRRSGVADNIAFLNFLPIVVSFRRLVQMFVDGPAREIVVYRHLAVSSVARNQEIDLLVCAHRKRRIPVILAIQFVHDLSFVHFATLFLGDQIFHRPIAELRCIEGGNLRMRAGSICFQLDFRRLQFEGMGRVTFCAYNIFVVEVWSDSRLSDAGWINSNLCRSACFSKFASAYWMSSWARKSCYRVRSFCAPRPSSVPPSSHSKGCRKLPTSTAWAIRYRAESRHCVRREQQVPLRRGLLSHVLAIDSITMPAPRPFTSAAKPTAASQWRSQR